MYASVRQRADRAKEVRVESSSFRDGRRIVCHAVRTQSRVARHIFYWSHNGTFLSVSSHSDQARSSPYDLLFVFVGGPWSSRLELLSRFQLDVVSWRLKRDPTLVARREICNSISSKKENDFEGNYFPRFMDVEWRDHFREFVPT